MEVFYFKIDFGRYYSCPIRSCPALYRITPASVRPSVFTPEKFMIPAKIKTAWKTCAFT